LDRKIHKFTAQENRNPQLTKEQWLDRYLYIDIHEIFFCSFPIELYKWITKLEDSQGRWKLDGPIVWTPKIIQKLEASEGKITRIVDQWLDRITRGFVIEFVVDTSVNYSEAERCFLK